MNDGVPDKIPNLDVSKVSQPVDEDTLQKPPGGAFQDYMNRPSQPLEATPTQAPGTTPYDLAKGQQAPMGTPTLDSINDQTTAASGTLNTLDDQLNTKNLKLKQSQKYLLRNKLSEANSHIRTAATKAGVDVQQDPPATGVKQNPIRRYLDYVSDSQNQLAAVQNKIKEISTNGGSLSPGDMLMIQVKLNKAQQALDYSSVLLGKAVDDIKMLFNVQI
jgi:hypothetical protein